MAAPKESAELAALLDPVVTKGGLVLESVVIATVNGTPVVRVTVDSTEDTGAVDSDTLAAVSRAVSKKMDSADPIDSEYLLEVSTPGAERELTQPRHWAREIGHLIRAKMRDGQTITGRLLSAEAESATLDVEGSATTILYAQVKKARPRVELTSDSKE